MVQSLLRFYQENQSLFTFIRRYNTSQQRRTDWGRTVSQQQPLIQAGKPVYANPITKQKTAHYDEELLVLFMNTMQQLSQQYGFRLTINPLYTLLTETEFKRFQASATRRLKQIRSRYFSDKLVRLWQLLHLYYAHQEQMRSQRAFREILIVRDFNIVFEDMIDALLSDPKPTLPAAFKDQPDGKRVDHIYAYTGLLEPQGDSIYHIGDSKYYTAGNTIGPESVFKQFTYARNVIQLNIDLLNEGKLAPPLRYRDEVTEGYAPTPNFFISAFVNDLNFGTDGLALRDDTDKLRTNRHFADRLFDRDTLLLQAYNINFLYVLATYVSPDAAQQNRFRESTRQRFRTEMVTYLNKSYSFWKITPHPSTFDSFVTKHFRQLIGRMYRPAAFETAPEQSLLIAFPNQNNTPAFLSAFEKEATLSIFTLS
ncbi:MAG: LlaJI family restriction endonuclease [Pedobacter sp.]|nr:MAG: LlaJI family restriction endonuclease [Pedobacter sp.]